MNFDDYLWLIPVFLILRALFGGRKKPQHGPVPQRRMPDTGLEELSRDLDQALKEIRIALQTKPTPPAPEKPARPTPVIPRSTETTGRVFHTKGHPNFERATLERGTLESAPLEKPRVPETILEAARTADDRFKDTGAYDQARKQPQAPAASVPPARSKQHAYGHVVEMLHRPNTTREALLLTEILGKPLSKRR